jgi:hypothetical protein
MPFFDNGRPLMTKPRDSFFEQILLAIVILLLLTTDDLLAQPGRPPRGGPSPTATVLTFEELPTGTAVTYQYGAKGVSFRGALIVRENTAHSGDRVLYSGNPVDEFDPGPLIIDFASGQRYVKLYAGTVYSQITATLTAYDAAGAVLVRDGPRSLALGQLSTTMQVTTPSPLIRRVELLYTPNTFEVIDDLEFDGQAPPPVPNRPPIVTITAPAPVCRLCRAPQTTRASYTIEGSVTGEQLASQAVIKMQVVRPPGSSTTSLYTYSVTLTGTGNSRTFSHPVTLGLGPTSITVEAENTGGLRGQASSSITYLPQPIRERLAQTGSLGTFVFGGGATPTPACTYAVYTNGAVAMVNRQTFVVRGAILGKWLSLRDPLGSFPRLGCPTGEDRAVVSHGQTLDGRVQDFGNGRIYAHTAGAFFVPPVFASAIDSLALGGEKGVGLPTADPISDSRPAFRTWLFQQFRRPSVDLPSTLEIRGDPPRLFVERQGGDGTFFRDQRRPRNPTLVESYNCSGTSGPCSVVAPPVEQPFADAGRFCNHETFNWVEFVAHAGSLNTYTPNPPEWVPIYGNYVQTPIWGAVRDSHRAAGDNPAAHENNFEPCPWPPGPGSIPTLVNNLINERICPSDWDVLISPLRGYRWMQAERRDHVAIEFEQVHAQAFIVGFGEPLPGHAVFASGRFIADCGHAPIKTEIHPPSVLAVVGTVTHNWKPATQADIWVNAFFPGGTGPGDAVEFEVHPPPRPSPSATLGVLYPHQPGIRVQVTFSNASPFGPVRVRVTAPRREPAVDKMGQMKWPSSGMPGGFQDRLLVYWLP